MPARVTGDRQLMEREARNQLYVSTWLLEAPFSVIRCRCREQFDAQASGQGLGRNIVVHVAEEGDLAPADDSFGPGRGRGLGKTAATKLREGLDGSLGAGVVLSGRETP